MGLARYGRSEWMTIILAGTPCVAMAVAAGWWSVAIVLGIVLLGMLSFFRDPWRSLPTSLPKGSMVSPADGTISAIDRVDDHVATGGPAIIIRIFLSVLNVHVNRAPCDSTVVGLEYVPGRFLDARTEKSARVNESNLITLRTSEGECIGVRQVSGSLARRIVCQPVVDDVLKQGQRIGMIKFGSTTELILPRPDDVEVLVQVGDAVRGVTTALAVLPEAS